MAIEANASDKQVDGGVQLYTGIGTFKVKAINPTLEELHAMGVMYQSEPEYTVNFGEEDLTKIVFWIGNDKVAAAPLEFIVTPGPWRSSTDKVKVYNAEGQDSWLPMNDDGSFETEGLPEFFKQHDTIYAIPKGMDKLTNCIRAWANVASGGTCKLETVDAVANGNVAELKALLDQIKDNEFRALLFVKDGKYQKVYIHHFGRVKPQRDALFTAAISKEYQEVKGEFSYEFKPYTPGEPAPDSSMDSTDIPDDNDWLDAALDSTEEDGL
jgi:hypothetical protein